MNDLKIGDLVTLNSSTQHNRPMNDLKIGDLVTPTDDGYWDGIDDPTCHSYIVMEIFNTNEDGVEFARCKCTNDKFRGSPESDEILKQAMKQMDPDFDESQPIEFSAPLELLGPIDKFERI
jgi:hypothetical protein